MNDFRIRFANEVGIQPAYIKGKEKHGLCYFTWHDSDAVGGQCTECNTIVWVDPRSNEILTEKKPDLVPTSGEGYRKYYENKIYRFLNSLRACPVCGCETYNRFINNVTFPRFPDGTEFDGNEGDIELVNVDPSTVEIWWANNAKQK